MRERVPFGSGCVALRISQDSSRRKMGLSRLERTHQELNRLYVVPGGLRLL
jgi:hypothetical protein